MVKQTRCQNIPKFEQLIEAGGHSVANRAPAIAAPERSAKKHMLLQECSWFAKIPSLHFRSSNFCYTLRAPPGVNVRAYRLLRL